MGRSGDEFGGLETLPPFLRVLLLTDGTVTLSLEAYFREPIEVEVLSHSELPSETSYPSIEVERSDLILLRRVSLRGRHTRAVYAFAQSVIAATRLSEDLRSRLTDGRKGIGEVIRESKLETYREILSIAEGEADGWAPYLAVDSAARVATRTYTVSIAGRATIAIQEVFPQSVFRQVAAT